MSFRLSARVLALRLGLTLASLAPTALAAQAPELLLARSDGGASFSALLKHQVEINDPVRFALSKEKALQLTKAQKDSLKALQRVTDRDRNRVIRELERRHPMAGGTELRTIPLTANDLALLDSVMTLTLANGPHVQALLDSAQAATYQAERSAFRPVPLPPERRAFRVDRVQPPPR